MVSTKVSQLERRNLYNRAVLAKLRTEVQRSRLRAERERRVIPSIDELVAVVESTLSPQFEIFLVTLVFDVPIASEGFEILRRRKVPNFVVVRLSAVNQPCRNAYHSCTLTGSLKLFDVVWDIASMSLLHDSPLYSHSRNH